MILRWKGAELKDGEIEKADMAALDEVVCLLFLGNFVLKPFVA